MITRLAFIVALITNVVGIASLELKEVNHKILHGLLGGVTGGITSSLLNKSFEDGAVSGALSGVVSEVMAEMLSPEIPNDLSNTEFQQEFIERAERSAKWGEFTGTLSAFLAGYDPSIAQQVGSNAVENNHFRTLFLALAAGVAWEADKILKTYERDGLEAALKHLGIAAVEGAVVVKAGVATVRHKTFKSLKKAYDFALSKSPMLRKALGRLEKKIESVESGIQSKTSNRTIDKKLFQEHHIISNKNPATKNHDLIELDEFNLESQTNKMLLPTKKGAEISTTTRSIHEGKHTNLVSQRLATEMKEAVDKGQVLGWGKKQYQEKLVEIINTEKQALKSGDRILNKNHRSFATDGGRVIPKEPK